MEQFWTAKRIKTLRPFAEIAELGGLFSPLFISCCFSETVDPEETLLSDECVDNAINSAVELRRDMFSGVALLAACTRELLSTVCLDGGGLRKQ